MIKQIIDLSDCALFFTLCIKKFPMRAASMSWSAIGDHFKYSQKSTESRFQTVKEISRNNHNKIHSHYVQI